MDVSTDCRQSLVWFLPDTSIENIQKQKQNVCNIDETKESAFIKSTYMYSNVGYMNVAVTCMSNGLSICHKKKNWNNETTVKQTVA